MNDRNIRVLLVFDGTAWFIRRVRVIEHDVDRDEKIYRCDEHIGGPYNDFNEAVHAFRGMGWTG